MASEALEEIDLLKLDLARQGFRILLSLANGHSDSVTGLPSAEGVWEPRRIFHRLAARKIT